MPTANKSNLFERQYNRDEWLQFLNDRLSIRIFTHPRQITQEDVEEFYHLGSVTLTDDKELGIYEIKTKPQTQLHHNRVQMRQLVAKQCQSNTEDGALAVYHDNENQWRFSFISMEYKLDNKGKTIRTESSPKRYTYLLGRNAKTRTAVKRFKQLDKSSNLNNLKDAFAVEPLNKEFYVKLFKWYEKAKSHVVFPNDDREEDNSHVSISLIRLLTRLLFVWFLKEKELVNRNFFELAKLKDTIDWSKDSSYYKAILQNLFFATLNREIKDRRFRTDKDGKPNSTNYLVTNLYRYKSTFLEQNEQNITKLFEKTPFLNGGLFECLDRDSNEEEQEEYNKDKSIRNEREAIRIDGFSDNRNYNKLKVPNELFFNNDDNDLGLIDLLDQYQFTVEESTPLDVNVALDPELLGMVFENLLAAYNPETRETARRQTGSYYTPREIVGYMVDESLKAYLASAAPPHDGNVDDLFLESSTIGELKEEEILQLIKAIEKIKILDPAVGSGAFPMGVLHRLVSLLGLIDPDNKRWRQRQIDVISKLDDPESREQMLNDIEIIFSKENRYNDFGRKLYLIQNSIYGVDVQPIAVQIAKLRFFISLAIEQEPTGNKMDNYGIKPLPNLETKFVSANSLIGLNKPEQIPIRNPKISKKEEELKDVRRKYFTVRTLKTKRKYKKQDEKLRKEIAELLIKDEWKDKTAKQIADWNPYNQNASADWFDPEWMFGMDDGFDVVIGNPPYIQLQKEGGKLGQLYKDAGYETFIRTGDIYQLFYEKGCKLLSPDIGILSYITSNSWLKANYGKTTRNYFSENHTPLRLLEMGKDIFENAIVDTNILIARNGISDETGRAVDMDKLSNKNFPPETNLWGELHMQGEKTWSILSDVERSIMNKMETLGTPMKEWDVRINYGIKTGYNKAFIIDNTTKQTLIDEDPNSAKIIKPILRGRDIKPYKAQWARLWLIATFPALQLDINDYPAVRNHLLTFGKERLEQSGNILADSGKSRKRTGNKWFETQDQIAYYEEFAKEKLFWIELVENGRFAYDDSRTYGEATTFVMTGNSLKYFCAVLNTSLIRWYLQQIAPTSGMGTLRWKKIYVETIPIPKTSTAEQQPFIKLVDNILSAKEANPSADTSQQEAEIDKLVYGLYYLTEEEIKTIQEKA